MTEDEEFEDVGVLDVEFGDGSTYTMMTYHDNGLHCTTFATQDHEGLWEFAPFPQHLLECEDCMDDLTETLREMGYVLVSAPEQLVRTC